MGMLAYFVHIFVQLNQLTPDLYLVMFIVSTLALAWALWTLFSYHRSSANSRAVGLVDLLFVGAFIGAVYAMRVMAQADCTQVRAGDAVAVSLGPLGNASLNIGIDVSVDKTCAMLKACFAFGIMNAIMFFFTAVLAWMHGGRMSSAEADRRHTHHSHRHSHRRHSGSHSHRSHRSSHSHHRVYV